jgi:hypothetical protein
MKPSLAFVVSGPAVWANAPPGKFRRAAAMSAAAPAPAFRTARRLVDFPVTSVLDLLMSLPSEIALRQASTRWMGRPGRS